MRRRRRAGILPNRFALGAATGTPASRISSRATGCAGERTPTSGRPAVTASGTAAVLGSSSVSGPGQNASISFATTRPSSPAGTTATRSSIARPSTCTIIGSHAGRCFAAKIFATAAGSSAFAPSPYTVSVGNATVPPARSNSAARATAACILGPQPLRLQAQPLLLRRSPPRSGSNVSLIEGVASLPHPTARRRILNECRPPRSNSSSPSTILRVCNRVFPASASSSTRPAPSSRTPSTTRPPAPSAHPGRSSASAATATSGPSPTSARQTLRDGGSAGPATGQLQPRYKVRIETETLVDRRSRARRHLPSTRIRARLPLRKVPHRVVPAPLPPSMARSLPARLIPPISAMPNPSLHLVLDETPIGDYAELEGPPAWIDRHPGPARRRSRHLPHRQLRPPLPRLEAAHRQPRRKSYLRRNPHPRRPPARAWLTNRSRRADTPSEALIRATLSQGTA